VSFSSSFKTSARCHAIASPSLSSSVASQTVEAPFTDLFNSDTTFFFSSDILYCGS